MQRIKAGKISLMGLAATTSYSLAPAEHIITFNLYTYNFMVLIIQKKLSGAVSIHFKQH
jgi:hypothetical protein